MWLRNLLFLGLIAGGAWALVLSLLPPAVPAPLTAYEAPEYEAPDFRAAVAAVDSAFGRTWAEHELTPTPPAPDLALARRLALGLMGTVPSLEEIRQFEQLPPGQRLTWWLDHVLADRRFADYFAERFARAAVGTEDGPFVFYRRRRLIAWLGDQFACNRPYDEVVRELLTDEGLWTDKPATNFVSVTVQPDNKNQPDPVRLAGRVTRAFLGLRLDCAQCHDHPFADWKQADFRGLAAFFGQTRVGFTGIYDDRQGEFEAEDRKTKATLVIAPRVPFAPELLPSSGTRRQRLAAWVTHPKNPYFARAAVNRVWALVTGRPLVEPVDNLTPDGPVPPALQILADDFAGHGFDLRRLIRVIAGSEAFRRDSASDAGVTEAQEKAWAAFPLTRLRPEQVAGGVLQSASVTTVDSESHVLTWLIRYGQQNDFVKRYGDSGEDEFEGRGGTVPQRLLMMNGELVREKLKESPFNAATRVAWLAPDDPRAIEVAYLAVLTRRPTPAEEAHFEAALGDRHLRRTQHLEDLFWALVNSTEFSWNH